MSDYGLEHHGIVRPGKVHWNLPVAHLVEEAVRRGEGVLTIAHEDTPDKYSAAENVPTQRGARTMTLDPKTHNVYVVTAKFGPAPARTCGSAAGARRLRSRPSP